MAGPGREAQEEREGKWQVGGQLRGAQPGPGGSSQAQTKEEALLVLLRSIVPVSLSSSRAPFHKKRVQPPLLLSVPPREIFSERENKKTMDVPSVPINLISEREKKERTVTLRNSLCFVTGDYNVYLFVQRRAKELLNVCHAPGPPLGRGWRNAQAAEGPVVREPQEDCGKPESK